MAKLHENTGECFTRDSELEKLILKVAHLMFLNRGIISVAMDDIAENVGITRKMLNHYFNRKDLVHQLIFGQIDFCKVHLVAIQNQGLQPLEEMKFMLGIIESFALNFSNVLLRNLRTHYREVWQAIADFSSGFIRKIVDENMSRGMQMGLYRSQMKKNIVIDLYFSMVLLLIEKDYGTGGMLKMAEAVAEMNSNFIYVLVDGA